MGENLDTWPQSVGSDARPLTESPPTQHRLPAHDNVADRAGGDLLKRFEQLLPHFKIELVALGMVEKDLRPLNATGSSLGVKTTRGRGADTCSGSLGDYLAPEP